jgi:hypothetical protein
MPTVNGPDEITTLDAGDDKVFFSDSNGDVKEVALGASGEVLTSAGPTADPTFSAIPAEPTVGADKIMYSNSSDVVSGVALGAAETVLTSSGLTSAPTWEAIAAGGGVYTTTTGSTDAIAIGDVVSLKGDGTVIPIVATWTPGMTTSSNTSWSYYNGVALASIENYYANGTTWISGIDSGNNPFVQPVTVTKGVTPVVTLGTQYPISGYSASSNGCFSSRWDPASSRIVMVWMASSSSSMYGSLGTVTGTGSTATVSWSTPFVVGGGFNANFIRIVETNAANGGLAGAYRNNINDGKGLNLIVNPAKTGFSTANDSSINAGNMLGTSWGYAGIRTRQPFTLAFESTNNDCLAMMWIDLYGNGFYTNRLDWSGGATGSLTCSVRYNNSGWSGTNLMVSGMQIIYDPTSQRFLSTFVTGNGETTYRQVLMMQTVTTAGGVVHNDEIHYGSGTVAVDVLNYVTSGIGNNGYSYAGANIVRSQTNKIIAIVDYSGTSRMVMVTATGGGTNTIRLAGTTSPLYYKTGPASSNSGFSLTQDAPDDVFLNTSHWSSGSMEARCLALEYASISSDAWIGISKTATTTSGEAIEVNVIGAIDEGQTGLTVGSYYYVQTDGTLSTSVAGADKLMGRAIAANRLLIENTGVGVAT